MKKWENPKIENLKLKETEECPHHYLVGEVEQLTPEGKTIYQCSCGFTTNNQGEIEEHFKAALEGGHDGDLCFKIFS